MAARSVQPIFVPPKNRRSYFGRARVADASGATGERTKDDRLG
jgi:hypothetical protein